MALPTYSFTTAPLIALDTITDLGGVASWYGQGYSVTYAKYQLAKSRGMRVFNYNGIRPASPSFATEDDGVALRVLPWIQKKYGIDRWYFWESTYYNNFQGNTGQTNVFVTAQTFGFNSSVNTSKGETGSNHSNGDGVLFYPGTDTLYPSASRGLSGPFVSLRMKHWRRGIQDIDYVEMARAINPTATDAIVNAAATGLWDTGVDDVNDPTYVHADIQWSTNADTWEAKRLALANIIKGI